MCKESEDALAVVGCYGDDALAGHSVAGIARLAAAAAHQSAAVEVDKHWQVLAHCLGWCPYVEVQAVFAHLLRAEVHVAEDVFLHRVGSVFFGLAHALPLAGGLWRLPAQVANGWSGKGYALECLNARLVGTLKCALGNVHSCGLLCHHHSCEQR